MNLDLYWESEYNSSYLLLYLLIAWLFIGAETSQIR